VDHVSLETLRADLPTQWAVLHGLQLCAQNVLDVATHVAAGRGRDPADYASAIDALGELGVLEPSFATRLRGIAGFRNVLVHGYLAVDLAIVHRLLTTHLGDFERFADDLHQSLGRP
jgi:uncharacterized protein YutE (UPF0331/DUF86 family)